MTPIRKLIIGFWIFIGGMLLWQFYNYDQGVKHEEVEHPTQQQFFFYNTNMAPAGGQVNPNLHAADVRQIAYRVQEDTPPGNFTCTLTVKNLGNVKAVGIQAPVYPYRGGIEGDLDAGHSKPVNDNDFLGQMVQWVNIPDLAPGETTSQSVTFLTRANVTPGTNPSPKIAFGSEKTKP